MMKKSDSGKGDSWRHMDRDKYRDNFDKIFGKKKVPKKNKKENLFTGKDKANINKSNKGE